jgi:hypothetical protein
VNEEVFGGVNGVPMSLMPVEKMFLGFCEVFKGRVESAKGEINLGIRLVESREGN